MIPFSVKEGHIRENHLGIFHAIVQAVQKLPDLPEYPLTCHAVARIVAPLAPGFHVVDGEFLEGYEHSWLQHEQDQIIIDPYPVAAGSPLIITTIMGSPWCWLYIQTALPTEKVTEAERVAKALQVTIAEPAL